MVHVVECPSRLSKFEGVFIKMPSKAEELVLIHGRNDLLYQIEKKKYFDSRQMIFLLFSGSSDKLNDNVEEQTLSDSSIVLCFNDSRSKRFFICIFYIHEFH